MSYLDTLNSAQKDAVTTTEGPVLIIAGAGAGKTNTITHRILHLIKNGTEPKKILAITFTNKAAKEMSDRVARLIKTEKVLNTPLSFSERPFISTFHAFGVHFLREEHALHGRGKHFVIFDQDDALSTIKSVMNDLSIDPKQFEPRRILSAISKQKGELVREEEYRGTVGNQYFPRMVSLVWERYEGTLRKEKAFDFDDLISLPVFLLRVHQDARTRWENRFSHIHVDEYQDTNVAQYELSKLLAGGSRNICVVGDIDQSIYSWRGADFRNVMNFEHDFTDAKVILLEENYRSTQNILSAANEIIKKNSDRKEKNLFTKKEEGHKLHLYRAFDEEDEARFVVEMAISLIDEGASPEQIAVLYRANFQSRALEDMFLRHSIPYQVLGVKFFERREIKDVLSYLRAALNPDSTHDQKRTINTPPRGIGKVTLAKLFAGEEKSLPDKMRIKINEYRQVLEDIRRAIGEKKPSETIRFVVKRTGLELFLLGGTEDEKERLENIYELASLATKYDALPSEDGILKLLEEASLASDQDTLGEGKEKEKRGVKLMTVHASKGLEFPFVFITGLEQDLFPHRGMGDILHSKDRNEEERRLFYVALTRAEKRLFLCYAQLRTVFGMKQVNTPSEFLYDIPEELILEDSPEKTISYDLL